MKPARQALVALLKDALDEAVAEAPQLLEIVPEVREYRSTEVEDLLGRGNGWANRHALELGGYRETPAGRWHFPLHGIKRWQERQASEQARAGLKVAS